MVYNAMKLFMEINPGLFDDCSHDYTEQQNSAAAREAARQHKWALIAEQAARRQAENGGSVPPRAQGFSVARVDENVCVSEDNQKRLDSLRLQEGDHNTDQQQARR
jgi:serine/threonine-protein phosphatase 2A regulatory subunit B'